MLHILGNVLAFIFALGVIIFVHEAGHLLVAKAFRMRVLTFSLGFGKRLWGRQRGETDYRISAVPLGGYVKLAGEDPDEEGHDPRDFPNRPRWQRILVYLAGPAMNGVLAVLLVAGLFMVGVDVPALQSIPAEVGTVEAGSPGDAAGIRPGDRIVAIDARPVEQWKQVAFAIMTSVGRELAVEVERDGERLLFTVVPARLAEYEIGDAGIYPRLLPRIAQLVAGAPAANAGLRVGDEVRAVDGRSLANAAELIAHIETRAGTPVRLEIVRGGAPLAITVVPATVDGKGRIGVLLSLQQRYGPARAFVESLRFNGEIARQSLVVVGKIFTREVKARSALAGPIEIAAQSGQAARAGWKSLVYLMAVISTSIGLLNLFPIPVLDGGQIALLLVESALRRDLPDRVKERVNQTGLALIVLLMLTVLYFDLAKNLPAVLRPGS
ncbi:MAG TPA: RIP metalloprotease RseP [Thermoanaerobaculia bacterium]|nr:RIP metalloprotease RseP [Thermoanaerobaculia bacterium]MDI9631054.1 RIP metalloprotease RseP [Acidobacteriota bacterium]OQC40916.1 MAG: putative zinc metalloprotease [Acidobacteria bacterium ADurb.Bin051]MBP7813475.1 RIP metalloprotease RseP [Thermoanaerobaculia bacterium]MBP8846222.1 RIP metalloprotease RseP [Thermoanaerobaculia bacterium]